MYSILHKDPNWFKLYNLYKYVYIYKLSNCVPPDLRPISLTVVPFILGPPTRDTSLYHTYG